MNVFTGGISMSGTLGGDETIVALQLSAAAMQRAWEVRRVFHSELWWLVVGKELIRNDNARVAVVIVVLSVSQEEVCLPLPCSKIDDMVW